MAAPDHYALLGVAPDASVEDIKRAFRRLAREWHPDVNPAPEAAAMFHRITQAHDLLSDRARRAEYDLQRLPPLDGDWRADPQFEDLLDTLFAKGPRAARPGAGAPERGADILLPLEITLADAARGHTTTVTYAARLRCGTCQGTGGGAGATLIACDACRGEGQLSEVTDGPFGRFVATRDCHACHGAGERLSALCADCAGSGRIRGERTATIDVPPGAHDGQKIRVPSAGHDGDIGARSGDLMVAVHIPHDPRFLRDGLDLIGVLEVPVLDAMLGTTATVPTITGDAVLDVPPGTSHGDELRLAGRGMPAVDGHGRGDLRYRVHLAVPAALAGEARAAVEDARRALSALEHARIRIRPQPRPGE